MYICICKAVRENDLRTLVEDGTVSSYACAREHLGLGTCCGQCKPEAHSFISEEVAKLAASLSVAA